MHRQVVSRGAARQWDVGSKQARCEERRLLPPTRERIQEHQHGFEGVRVASRRRSERGPYGALRIV